MRRASRSGSDSAPEAQVIPDVWRWTKPKYRARSVILLLLNAVLFAGLGIFTLWLRIDEFRPFSTERYWELWWEAFDPTADEQTTLIDFLVYPIPVDQVPMMMVIVGLVLASLTAIPILVSMLYRFPFSLIFTAVIAFVAVVPWLALIVTLCCWLVRWRVLQFSFRFATALISLLPLVGYYVLATRNASGIEHLRPIETAKLYVPWVLALIAACVLMAIVLMIAKLVNYRPGAIAPLLAVMFALPVVLFEVEVGRNELHYRVIESRFGSGEKPYFVGQVDAGEIVRRVAELREETLDDPAVTSESLMDQTWLVLRFRLAAGRGGALPSFQISSTYAGTLDDGIVSDDLQKVLAGQDVRLSRRASVVIQEPGRRWLINNLGQWYTVTAEGGKLSVVGDDEVAMMLREDFAARQDVAIRACGEFRRRFPTSRYIPNVLYLEGRAIDMRLGRELSLIRETLIIEHREDFPRDASLEVWKELHDRFPDSNLSSVSCLRLAKLAARGEDVGEAIRLLDELTSRSWSRDDEEAEGSSGRSRGWRGLLSKQPASNSLDVDVAAVVQEGRKLRELLVNNRDPARNDLGLRRLHRFNPNHSHYQRNLASLRNEILRADPESLLLDNLEVLIAKSEGRRYVKIPQLKACIDSLRPDSDALPEAWFELGKAYQEDKDPNRAHNAFQEVVAIENRRGRPDSPWADEARQRLAAMGVAGGVGLE